jgi:hypothetical protein
MPFPAKTSSNAVVNLLAVRSRIRKLSRRRQTRSAADSFSVG